MRCSRSYYTCVWLLLRMRMRRRLGMDGQDRHHACQGKPGDAQGGTLMPMKAHSPHPCNGKTERATSFIDPKFQTRAVVPPIAGSGDVPSPSVGDRQAGGARCITCQELPHHSRINSEANAMQGMLCNAAWCGVLWCNVVEATTRSPPFAIQQNRLQYT